MKTRLAVAVLALVCMLEPSSGREPDCCAHCGCKCEVHKVCRLVCEEKEVKEVQWTCKCEDFCVPGRSELCGQRCECDPSKPHCEDCEKVWKPTRCAEVRTRNVLVKNEVTKKVPHYQWVVEYCCDRCGKVWVPATAATMPAKRIDEFVNRTPRSIPEQFELAEKPRVPWAWFYR